ncbi:MAG: aspartate/glutamate racemase family protein [bacterium]
MGMKIWWQHIFPPQEQIEKETGMVLAASVKEAEARFLENLRTVAHPDTEVEIHYVKHSSYVVHSYYMEMLNNIWLLDGVIEAERQGYDAVIIGCADDPGIREARQAVDIPVVAPAEAAMMLACTLGSRFGMITVLPELVAFCERNIRNYGMESRAVRPVRVHDLGEDWVNALFEMLLNPQVIFPGFEELCRACIQDGAEVILPCCCALSPAASLAGYREVPGTGVPVVDVTQAALKLAETLVDLKRAVGLGKSRRCTYKSTPPAIRDMMRSLTYGAPGKS